MLNVKDFGAVGDGQADDTDAFDRAFAAANGNPVHCPAGAYRLSALVNCDIRSHPTGGNTLQKRKS